jgi:ABC-type sugar transport system ATPase subunit
MFFEPAALFLFTGLKAGRDFEVGEVILEVRKITKTFPGVKALDEVDFTLEKGTVHALVGENGAGKSTLMMILGGVYTQDSGDILLEGRPVHFESAYEANQKGISVVYQELSLVPNLSVAENIFAHRQPTRGFNLINWDALRKQTTEILTKFELEDINPWTPVGDLTMGKRQVVEILKAMSVNPKILIFDEPTSSLTDVETRELFQNIRILQNEGISIIYISHHLQEIFQIADTVTILRDGKHVCDANVDEVDENFLISNMVGRQIGNMYGNRESSDKIGNTIFEVNNLSRGTDFEDVSFHIRQGEIVGFSGLVGAGRTELGRAIFGAEPAESGSILLEGKSLSLRDTKQAIRAGIGYLTEDRKDHGLYITFDIKTNLVSNHLKDFSSVQGFLKRKKIEAFAQKQVNEFNIVTPSIAQLLNNLSGGNQQKVLVASWFGISPRILIVDEPTRGVDVGAKNDIYKLLRRLASEGVGIMLISSDLPEIIGISDRIYVMREGKIVGELAKKDATEEIIIGLAAGIHRGHLELNT